MPAPLIAVTKLVIHHTESPMSATSFEDVRRWHIEERKWPMIGYHAVIDMRGRLHRGRDEIIQGAHAYAANTCSLGVCVIGHFDRESPRRDQWRALTDVLEEWCRKYRLTPSAETIIGHRDVEGTTKSCPGDNLYQHIPWLREHVRKKLLAKRAAESLGRA